MCPPTPIGHHCLSRIEPNPAISVIATATPHVRSRSTSSTKTEPIQAHVRDALLGGMAPPEHGYDMDDAARMLARPGYHHMETGWTRLDNGVTAIACRTDMPGVTAAMWDWWFGWHGGDSARYKLWCPDAHQFSAVGDDRSADRSLTDRQRYIGNVSYADEYLGGILHRLTIRFVDPARLWGSTKVRTPPTFSPASASATATAVRLAHPSNPSHQRRRRDAHPVLPEPSANHRRAGTIAAVKPVGPVADPALRAAIRQRGPAPDRTPTTPPQHRS